MDKMGYIPLNTDNWLVFSLYEIDGSQHTGAVNGEFTVDMIRDGVNVAVPGLTVYEIGSGRYHITNQASNVAYQSSSEEQVYIRVSHDTHDGIKLFHFWARDVDGDVDYPTAAEISSEIDEPTAAEIADAVWDEAISGHTGAGSFGAKNQRVVPSETLDDYKADVSGLPTAAAVADAVWDEAAADHVSAGSFGEMIRRVVGLMFENYKITDPVFSGANMTSCRLRLYDDETLANEIHSYTLTATYSGSNLSTFQVVKD